jgi:phage protein D
MATSKGSATPSLCVKIKGTDLPPAAYTDLIEASVHEDLEAPAMLTLKLLSWDNSTQKITWADDDLFAVGNAMEIEMGYTKPLSPIAKGEITGLELEVEQGKPPTLTVRGYDRSHRLTRGHKTRSFIKMADSDIAARIAQEQGLSVSTVSTKVKLDYVMQHNQTDLAFLRQRAALIGYEVVVLDRKLHFRPHQTNTSAVVTLKASLDLVDFFPRLSARNQAGAVEVRGWNPKTKKALVGKAPSKPKTVMGKSTGLKTADKAFGKAVVKHVNRPVFTQAEADQIAAGQLDTMALDFITGDGTCFGQPALRAGHVIAIQEIGTRFSGEYYVTSATHTYTSENGYRTTFTVRRNAT